MHVLTLYAPAPDKRCITDVCRNIAILLSYLQFRCAQVGFDLIWQIAALPPQGFDSIKTHLTATEALQVS